MGGQYKSSELNLNFKNKLILFKYLSQIISMNKKENFKINGPKDHISDIFF